MKYRNFRTSKFLEYFKKKKFSSNDDTEITVTKVVTSATQNISNAELSFIEYKIEKSVKRPSKHQKTIPKKMKRKVGIYVDSYFKVATVNATVNS